MIKSILQKGETSLLEISKPIDFSQEPKDEDVELINDLVDTVRSKKGYGLAAPQIGVNKRIIVVLNPKTDVYEILINPKLIAHKSSKRHSVEGCLSNPKKFSKIKRFKEITVEAYDINLNYRLIKADKVYANILQHEIDHLNGKVIWESS
jgi:peptide deformylase